MFLPNLLDPICIKEVSSMSNILWLQMCFLVCRVTPLSPFFQPFCVKLSSLYFFCFFVHASKH